MGFLENLYFGIGKKIKNWAIWMAIIEAIGSVITGIVFLCVFGVEDGWWGLIISVCGPVLAYVNTWLLYGFGELIDKACDIADNTNISVLSIREEIARRNKEAEEERRKRIEEERNHREALEKNRSKETKEQKENRESQKEPHDSSFTVLNAYTLICNSCKYAQSANNKECTNCGATFVKE